MVDLKIRTAEFGKCETKVDCEIFGHPMDVYATMIELEKAVHNVLSEIEERSDIHVIDAFISNLIESFE